MAKKDETTKEDTKKTEDQGFIDKQTLDKELKTMGSDIDKKLSDFFGRIETFVKKFGDKPNEATSERVGARGPVPIGEIGQMGDIERVTERNFIPQAELEEFMNQMVTILVHPSAEEGDYDVAVPNVNGMNQPIIRGVQIDVKRKYVEALARCRVTKYIQNTPDPRMPDKIDMMDTTVLRFPFAVLKDPHPKGKQWLDSILAQPA